jgi:hypothetical protein
MNGGIDQLVDTYKGNPQPLQAKVQKDQQSQPPGQLTPDLEEAIALQKIAELRQGAQNQQAMQAGGAQQSVVDKLKQMLGGVQQQGQPVMAARGGSIDQLMSNLGRHYAGGGIVAFNGEENNNPVEDPNAAKRSWIERALYENISPAEKERRRRLALLAAANQGVPAQPTPAPAQEQSASTEGGSLLEKLLYSNITPAEQRRREALQKAANERVGVNTPIDGFSQQEAPKENWGATLEKLLYSNITPVEQKRREALQAAANERAGISAPVPPTTLSNRAALNAADAGLRSQPGASNRALLNAADAGLRSQPAESAPAQARPAGLPGAGGIGGGPARSDVEAMDPMEIALRKSIMDALAQDPEAIRKKAMEQNAQFMGLDALLKPAQDRIAAREAMIKQMQGERTPAWAEALIAAGKPVRGGLGTLLGQMGNAAQATREGYQAQDLKFFDELSKLNAEIEKAKIEGRYKDVAAGQAAVKDLISEKRQAEQSGTSLLNKQATLAQTKQIADDNRAARAQAAGAQAESKKAQLQQKQQNWLAEQERKWQDTLSRNPDYKTAITQRSMYERLLSMSTDPNTQEKAQAAIDAQNEKIAKMMPTTMGGAANIPPPPPGAVREVKKP